MKNKYKALKYKEFKVDLSMKRYVMVIAHKRLIYMINVLHHIDLDVNLEDIFGNNEGIFVVGDKQLKISDLVINTITKEKIYKFVWEFQTYYDSEMGERIIMYQANNFVREKDNTLRLVDSVILYFILNKPAIGYEGINMKIGEFSVARMDFGKYEIITAKTKYFNVFKILFGDKDNDPRLDLFKVLYIYKYKKDIEKLKTEDYKHILKECYNYIQTLEGIEKCVANKIYCDITHKLEYLENDKDLYEEELKYMEELYF